ncbi:hypothetical protein ABID25_006684 [Mesorhizobium abyssinicae]
MWTEVSESAVQVPWSRPSIRTNHIHDRLSYSSTSTHAPIEFQHSRRNEWACGHSCQNCRRMTCLGIRSEGLNTPLGADNQNGWREPSRGLLRVVECAQFSSITALLHGERSRKAVAPMRQRRKEKPTPKEARSDSGNGDHLLKSPSANRTDRIKGFAGFENFHAACQSPSSQCLLNDVLGREKLHERELC